MKLKDGLILRKVANQYVIVPIGKRTREIQKMVYISSSAAFLWEYMQKADFTVSDLVEKIMGYYTGVTEEMAAADVTAFLNVLKQNNILEPEPGENESVRGSVAVRYTNDSD